MKFTISRDELLRPLQQVCAIAPNKPQLEVMSNLLIEVTNDNKLLMTASDLEIELTTCANLDDTSSSIIGKQLLLPAKKFLDITKGLPADSVINVEFEEDRVQISASRSRFNLSTQNAENYPSLMQWQPNTSFEIEQNALRLMMEATSFSMANGDARYFLNGMRVETLGNLIKSVTTDGYRLSLATAETNCDIGDHKIIIPRKSVLELIRLLADNNTICKVEIGSSNIRITLPNITFSTKLIDGNYPDYARIFPVNPDRILEADLQYLKNAVVLAAILSDDHSVTPVRFTLTENMLKVNAYNQNDEESEEILDVSYEGSEMEVAFNIRYLLDIFNALKCDRVRFKMVNENSGCLIENCDDPDAQYLLMPMRI